MAKAGKFAAAGEQSAAPDGSEQNGAPQKPARRPRSKPAASAPVQIEVAATTAESPVLAPVPPVAPPEVADGTRTQLQDALAELRALREQVRAARDETVGALNRVRAEAAAAATEVAQIAHQCRQTGERLIAELGEQSLALGRVRQAFQEGNELAREATVSREELRALRADCDATGLALGALGNQTRTEYREVFAEATEGVRRLMAEVEALRARVAETRRVAESPPETEPTTAPLVHGHGRSFSVRFGCE